MSEPIPVHEALKALRMAQEACNKATPGPWYRDKRYSEVTSGRGPSELFLNIEGAKQQEDADFIVAARAVLPGMVEYLIDSVSPFRPHDKIAPDCRLGKSLAPILAWASTREEWSE